MGKYRINQSKRGFCGPLGLGLLLLGVGFIVAAVAGQIFYSQGLRPVSTDQQTQIITIKPGSGVDQIAQQLEQARLIKSARALRVYAHLHGSTTRFQAGSYALAPNAGTAQIVKTLTQGRVATRLVTILPGRRIDQIQADLINDGFAPEAVVQALKPAQYLDLPVMQYVPANTTTLEGLLWPDSYQKDAVTGPDYIIREALKAMGNNLTPDVISGLKIQNLTPYQGLVLASIIEQEVSKPNDRAQAAQVFLSRLKVGMMLGSDVTAIYGSIAAGQKPNLTYDSPYNTLINPGLPPTPISSVSAGSLTSVTRPANTDWLYFVAGDDGTTYFSRTFAEHEALITKYCHTLCGR